MLNRWSALAFSALLFFVSVVVVSARQAPANGWTLPADAAQQTNPVAGDAAAISAGKQLFAKNCQRCHGPGAKGDGPDGDPDSQADMDLTVARRAARNPDGVVFYKLWNGRAKPKMPAFKDTLSQDDAWKIVAYVQTLRAKE